MLVAYIRNQLHRIGSSPVFKRMLCGILCTAALGIQSVHGGDFEVGEAVLPASINNTFTRVNFLVPFDPGTTPNVFPMTTEDGDDPCTLRIRNVDNAGFDAVCQEPINEDRSHPGMAFDYIAIADGGVTVPLDGGGGTVVFQSECSTTTTQQYGNSCVGCSGARAFDTITFPSAFSGIPSLLTQIQTTNNLVGAPTNDPIFINTAIDTGSLAATGFGVAVEQMEAGTGPVTTAERICYLAVENNGCQSLDFSSLGGPPTPITFNAVLGGQNVDGHDNNCTTGEGATFTPGCFSSTPIAVAGKRSRRGGDGGILRRCSTTTSEIILTFDEDQISNAERSHIDELSSVIAFGNAFTTPVTLNQASISQFGRKTLFEWQTSAETFHLGFHLWGELDGQWIQLNHQLVRGDGIDHAGVRDYHHSLRLNRYQTDNISQFGISSLDNSGREEFYGPFSVDQDYGEEAINQAVDWQETRNAFNTTMHDKGYVLLRGRWRMISDRRRSQLESHQLGVNDLVVNLTVKNQGIHSLRYADISNLTQQLLGTPIDHLALTLNGEAMPRHIISDDNLFNSGDQIVFTGLLPTGEDAIYLKNYQYQLRIDPQRAVAATQYDGSGNSQDNASSVGLVDQQLTSIKAYSAALSNGDPWYDSTLFSTGSPASQAYSFTLDEYTDTSRTAELDITLFGSIDFPIDENNSPDHHVIIRVNGQQIEELLFDGLVESISHISIPPDMLAQGENSVTITLPGDTGYQADIVLIDRIKISTYRQLSGASQYEFIQSADIPAYQLSVNTEPESLQLFAYRSDGALARIHFNPDAEGEIQFTALPNHGGTPRPATRYALNSENAWPSPGSIELIQPQNLHRQATDYLIVAHPAFIGEQLQQFAEQKEAEGYQTRVVDWLAMVNTYGYANNTPQALQNFLRRASIEHPISNILIVGGNTYDYLNVTGQNVVNFIPTHYRPVSVFAHTPSDNPYADLDGDSLPDLAIGRWPVRDLSDLTTILKKNRDWHSNIQTTQFQDSLLIAQPNDSRNLNFAMQMEGKISVALRQIESFGSRTTVYLQDLIDQGAENPITTARDQIRDSINQGVELVSFAGHGSTSSWGFQSIVNTDFVHSLQNAGKPTIVMPLACYTTYYESPSINTLAHQWLFAGDKGAVAIHGASVLGDYRENAVFAERYLQNTKHFNTIGEAILESKKVMSANNQMLNNWALLGDPTLPLR